MKAWEITAAVIGSVIAICGAVCAALSIYNYCKNGKLRRASDDFGW